MLQELPKTYQPAEVESRWYGVWESRGLFGATSDSGKKPYTIVIPPPNITGSLHMGHALNNTIQDILIRTHRMQGYEALWIPGTDHAGIATQTMVEKDLAREGKKRTDVGRDAFLERVWAWRDKYGRTIVEQLKRLGASCDWSRERFTMDAQCTRAVREAFYRLYRKGYIYRGKYIVNWCPRCLTALSDLEAEREEDTNGKIYHLRYPLEKGDFITIATTRPETILADTAIAVNPQDDRYRALVGSFATLPLVDRRLPIIADDIVEKDFGSGALKVTPAHDLNDFEIGRRHDLERLVCMDERGVMNDLAGKYQGQDRFACRKAILDDLREGGFLVQEEPYVVALSKCYRCHTVLEPYLSDQWFMKMDQLAKPAIEVVKNGRIKFFPERFADLYLRWMENLRDWVLSRQLWWGHRVPIWTCANGHVEAYLEDPSACSQCQSTELRQETDVLDTWFSSGLWPLSTLGWPDDTADLRFFYPTSVLSTDRGILYLWVARMIMTGLEFKGEVPYDHVYIHATVLTKDGRRMSKSLGTGIDPLVLFEQYGTDATRFGLAWMTGQGQDIRFSEERIQMSRNFANKIWNASRLVLRFMSKDAKLAAPASHRSRWSLEDRWILSRSNRLVTVVGDAIKSYNFDVAARELYEFFWDELCDWYLEMIKPVFYDRSDKEEQEKTVAILEHVLSVFLRVMHPIMPFLTEEVWQQLPGERDSIVVAPWPQADGGMADAEAESQMALLMEAVRGIRNMRSELNVPPNEDMEAILVFAEASVRGVLEGNRDAFRRLAHADPLKVVEALAAKPPTALSVRCGGGEIFLPVNGHVDVGREIERLQRELTELAGHLERARAKLSKPDFVGKAKPEVVERERARAAEQEANIQKVEQRLQMLRGLGG